MNRYATKKDALEIFNASEGDYIIDTKNDVHGIRLLNGQITLGAGKKILIHGGKYSRIDLDLSNCHGTQENPIIITNFNGQVEWGYSTSKSPYRFFSISNGKFFKLTGRYNPLAMTGDYRYVGHGTGVQYAGSRGNYGFYGNPKWSEEEFNSAPANILRIGNNSNYYEVEYVEVGNGGFAGFNLKTDKPVVPAGKLVVNIHDNYIHDTGAEGIYFGHMNLSGSETVTGHINNNRVVRTGTEALQVTNGGSPLLINNNVFIGASLTYRSPFYKYQDNMMQLRCRNGHVELTGNIFIGGARNMLFVENSFSSVQRENDPIYRNDIDIHGNLFIGGLGNLGYIGASSDEITRINIDGNFFGKTNGQYFKTNTDPTERFSAPIRCMNKKSIIYFYKNRFEDSSIMEAVSDNVIIEDNELNAKMPSLNFNNKAIPELYQGIELWAYGLPYSVGQLVMYKSLAYLVSVPIEKSEFSPDKATGEFELVDLPEDDFRLRESIYPIRVIGLADTLFPEPLRFNVYGSIPTVVSQDSHVGVPAAILDWVGNAVIPSIVKSPEDAGNYRLTRALLFNNKGNLTIDTDTVNVGNVGIYQTDNVFPIDLSSTVVAGRIQEIITYQYLVSPTLAQDDFVCELFVNEDVVSKVVFECLSDGFYTNGNRVYASREIVIDKFLNIEIKASSVENEITRSLMLIARPVVKYTCLIQPAPIESEFTAQEHWNQLIVKPANGVYRLQDVLDEQGDLVAGIGVRCIKSDTSGFNYFQGFAKTLYSDEMAEMPLPAEIFKKYVGVKNQSAVIIFYGLTSERTYELSFVCNGRDQWNGMNHFTEISVNQETKESIHSPFSDVLDFHNVKPVNGEIIVSISNKNSDFGILNAIIFSQNL